MPSEAFPFTFQGSAHSREEENQLRDPASKGKIVSGDLNNLWGQGLQVTGMWELLTLESPSVLPYVGRLSLRNRFAWNHFALLYKVQQGVTRVFLQGCTHQVRKQSCWWIMLVPTASCSGVVIRAPTDGSGAAGIGHRAFFPLLLVTSTGRTASHRAFAAAKGSFDIHHV